MKNIYLIVKAEEEKIINQVLESYLGRKPTLKDAEKCIMYYRIGESLTYDLAYDHIKLGQISFNLDDISKCKIEFNPA